MNEYQILLLFHLIGLAISYGTVVLVDVAGILWVFNKKSKSELLVLTKLAQPIIWCGLVVLMVSGKFLSPDFTIPLTQLKMSIVLLIIFNGLNLHFVQKNIQQNSIKKYLEMPKWLLIWSGLSILLSQLAWISATTIGLINTTTR